LDVIPAIMYANNSIIQPCFFVSQITERLETVRRQHNLFPAITNKCSQTLQKLEVFGKHLPGRIAIWPLRPVGFSKH